MASVDSQDPKHIYQGSAVEGVRIQGDRQSVERHGNYGTWSPGRCALG